MGSGFGADLSLTAGKVGSNRLGDQIRPGQARVGSGVEFPPTRRRSFRRMVDQPPGEHTAASAPAHVAGRELQLLCTVIWLIVKSPGARHEQCGTTFTRAVPCS